MKTLLISLLLALAFQISFGQELAEGEYWESLYHGKQSIWEYKNFTKDEVIKANQKLILLKNHTPQNEWEGKYESGVYLGESLLYWNSENGFVHYFFYHTLKYLNYGKAINKNDLILFTSEKPTPAKDYFRLTESPIKVKIGEKHFLIPKRHLKLFCEYVVGLRQFFESDIQSKFWTKFSERWVKDKGLPILPEKYKHFLAYPVEGKIIKLGKRKIQYSTWLGKSEIDGVKYFITLNVGKNQNVKENTQFYIPELEETATIERLFSNSSVASISRKLDENNKDICFEGNTQATKCPQISIGMKAKTEMAFE